MDQLHFHHIQQRHFTFLKITGAKTTYVLCPLFIAQNKQIILVLKQHESTMFMYYSRWLVPLSPKYAP